VTFEKGVGDAAITYENEVLVAKKEGQQMDYVVPPSRSSSKTRLPSSTRTRRSTATRISRTRS
jgi:ABC-type sulfate transport system substrate-binding protein